MGSTNVLICQLAVAQKKDMMREWVDYADVEDQVRRAWQIADETHADLVIFPETCYFPELFDEYTKRSEKRIIVAGTGYNDAGINEAHVFQNKRHLALRKIFPSPIEVMELNHPNTLRPDEVIKDWETRIQRGDWPDYFISLPDGRKAVVLTCMDYYRLGYYLAGSSLISPKLWGMIAPASNGRQDIFLRLSGAIHDANDKVYSIVVNSRNETRPPDNDQGGSYIYGPITSNVRSKMLSIGQTDTHFSAIYRLGDGAESLALSLLPGEDITFFARSKDFFSTPTNVKHYDLKGETEH